LYMKRIELFFAEFNMIQKQYHDFETSKKFFNDMERDIKKVNVLLEKKSPSAYIVPSVNSAIIRVFVSNTVAAVTIANPLNNPYFWDLTWRTMISVFMVNFIDYYFNVFTAMTNKTNKVLRLSK